MNVPPKEKRAHMGAAVTCKFSCASTAQIYYSRSTRSECSEQHRTPSCPLYLQFPMEKLHVTRDTLASTQFRRWPSRPGRGQPLPGPYSDETPDGHLKGVASIHCKASSLGLVTVKMPTCFEEDSDEDAITPGIEKRRTCFLNECAALEVDDIANKNTCLFQRKACGLKTAPSISWDFPQSAPFPADQYFGSVVRLASGERNKSLNATTTKLCGSMLQSLGLVQARYPPVSVQMLCSCGADLRQNPFPADFLAHPRDAVAIADDDGLTIWKLQLEVELESKEATAEDTAVEKIECYSENVSVTLSSTMLHSTAEATAEKTVAAIVTKGTASDRGSPGGGNNFSAISAIWSFAGNELGRRKVSFETTLQKEEEVFGTGFNSEGAIYLDRCPEGVWSPSCVQLFGRGSPPLAGPAVVHEPLSSAILKSYPKRFNESGRVKKFEVVGTSMGSVGAVIFFLGCCGGFNWRKRKPAGGKPSRRHRVNEIAAPAPFDDFSSVLRQSRVDREQISAAEDEGGRGELPLIPESSAGFPLTRADPSKDQSAILIAAANRRLRGPPPKYRSRRTLKKAHKAAAELSKQCTLVPSAVCRKKKTALGRNILPLLSPMHAVSPPGEGDSEMDDVSTGEKAVAFGEVKPVKGSIGSRLALGGLAQVALPESGKSDPDVGGESLPAASSQDQLGHPSSSCLPVPELLPGLISLDFDSGHTVAAQTYPADIEQGPSEYAPLPGPPAVELLPDYISLASSATSQTHSLGTEQDQLGHISSSDPPTLELLPGLISLDRDSGYTIIGQIGLTGTDQAQLGHNESPGPCALKLLPDFFSLDYGSSYPLVAQTNLTDSNESSLRNALSRGSSAFELLPGIFSSDSDSSCSVVGQAQQMGSDQGPSDYAPLPGQPAVELLPDFISLGYDSTSTAVGQTNPTESEQAQPGRPSSSDPPAVQLLPSLISVDSACSFILHESENGGNINRSARFTILPSTKGASFSLVSGTSSSSTGSSRGGAGIDRSSLSSSSLVGSTTRGGSNFLLPIYQSIFRKVKKATGESLRAVTAGSRSASALGFISMDSAAGSISEGKFKLIPVSPQLSPGMGVVDLPDSGLRDKVHGKDAAVSRVPGAPHFSCVSKVSRPNTSSRITRLDEHEKAVVAFLVRDRRGLYVPGSFFRKESEKYCDPFINAS